MSPRTPSNMTPWRLGHILIGELLVVCIISSLSLQTLPLLHLHHPITANTLDNIPSAYTPSHPRLHITNFSLLILIDRRALLSIKLHSYLKVTDSLLTYTDRSPSLPSPGIIELWHNGYRRHLWLKWLHPAFHSLYIYLSLFLVISFL